MKQIYDHYGLDVLEKYERGGGQSKGEASKVTIYVTLEDLYNGK